MYRNILGWRIFIAAILLAILAAGPVLATTDQTVDKYTDDVNTETTLRYAIAHATDPTGNTINFLHSLTYLPLLTMTDGTFSLTTPVTLNAAYTDVHTVTIANTSTTASATTFSTSASL